jgi:hypothetical protein
MTERGGVLASLLVALLLFLWLRFLAHVDPRFPGSLVGSSLGIAAALLMLVPLAYTVAKRLFRVRGTALRTFLAWHIYAALVGAILALLHTGHKFDNPLGVLLTIMTLVVVLSGFIGRYLLQQTSRHLAERRQELERLHAVLDDTGRALGARAGSLGVRPGMWTILAAKLLPWGIRDPELRAAAQRGVETAGALAVIDASLALHERVRRWFRLWMRFHFALTAVLYLLLASHVLVVSYYGLRWLPE